MSQGMAVAVPKKASHKVPLRRQFKAARGLLLMFIPGFLLILLFNYGPMYGLQIAFKDFKIMRGIWGSNWVGFEHFQRFFTSPVVLRVLKNTIEISLMRLVFGFPAPIILALLINELRDGFFKRFAQTVSYLPHFISWVIIAALVRALLSPSTGVVNAAIKALGFQPIYFLVSTTWFRPVLILSAIWKEVGWGSVLYLAALSSVDPTLYEAAIVDGATRIQRMRHISLPTIAPVMSIVLILNMGGILDAGFDQIFNMYNTNVFEVADIIDTYVYRAGLISYEYSFASAVGLFKSLVGLIMVLSTNAIVRRLDRGSALW